VVASTDSIYVFTALANRNLVAIFDFVDGIPKTRDLDLAIKMYPNPACDLISISLNNENHRIEAIKVFDMRGKEVLSLDYPVRTDVYTFNAGHLLPGTYLVRIISSEGIANRRLIVM
jgi:hypothetical protein